MILPVASRHMGDGARIRSLAVAGQIRPGTRTVLAALAVASIRPNPKQPRRHFAPQALAQLADSIKSRGLLQPIVVARDGDGYLIMAGERRWRAAALAGLDTIPALIRDDDPLEVAMIENLQRQDLSALEEAEGLGQLIERFGYTHEELAEMMGKSRPYVSNTLALRRLPDDIKAQCHADPGISREILIHVARAESAERQTVLWRLARLRKLSVEKFRAEAAGDSPATDVTRDLARLVRRLGRKLRKLDVGTMTQEDHHRLERILLQARGRLERALKALQAP